VQSHLNYCSLVWGFTCKSKIDTLFSKQKSGLRAVIPGHINYRYRDGEIPGHTKTSFKEYGILTVQGIIAKNALTLLYRINQHGDLLPQSVRDLVPDNVPSKEDNHETSSDWLLKYGSTAYKNSIFYKGPLLYISNFHTETTFTSIAFTSTYKSNIKFALIEQQSTGDSDDWPCFLLNDIRGLRKSARTISNTHESGNQALVLN
jgi:hypothetical protein